MDEAREMNQVQSAFRSIPSFTNEISEQIWSVLAGILHLGEIGFLAAEGQAEGCLPESRSAIKYAASALGVSDNSLSATLCTQVLGVHGDIVNKNHTVNGALYTRDAMAKAIYERLFNFIIAKVNEVTQNKKPDRPTVIPFRFSTFMALRFLRKIAIKWVKIDYFDNQPICKLVEEPKRGILAILDDACAQVGKVTDEMFLREMDTKLKGHQHYTSRGLNQKDKAIGHDEFRIQHYAGEVKYDVNGFIDKNKDYLYEDIKRLLYGSSSSLVRTLFPDGATNKEMITRKPPTSGRLFQKSMDELVQAMAQSDPWYIRCIKPNDHKSAAKFDSGLVEHQVRYLGLLENIRVRRAGFAHRVTYVRFVKRYKMICPTTWRFPSYDNDKTKTEQILKYLGWKDESVMGKTKLFIRSPDKLIELENAREAALPRVAKIMQTAVRKWQFRCYVAKLIAKRKIVTAYRRYKLRQRQEMITEFCMAFKPVLRATNYGANAQLPPIDPSLSRFRSEVVNLFYKWRKAAIYKSMPDYLKQAFWPKMSALEVNKNGYWPGVQRMWLGDYLSQPGELSGDVQKYKNVIQNELLKKHPASQILFSSYIQKINRFNKSAGRALVITDRYIAKLDSKSLSVLKEVTTLDKITGITVAQDTHSNLLIVHTGTSDLVCCLKNVKSEERVGELLGTLLHHYDKSGARRPKVSVSEWPSCRLGNKPKTVRVEYKEGATNLHMEGETILLTCSRVN
ncbi:unnamed protein product, partial [Mesorhabditis spiculigera]